jgi:hypothetical protein
MKKLLVTAVLGAAMAATPALAQDNGGGHRMHRDQTRQEAQQRADMLFQMLDANRDGMVTKAEADAALAQFEAARGGDKRSGRMQQMIDDAFSSTQSISLQQFEAQALAKFDAADLNHDGTLSSAERDQRRAQKAQKSPGQ